MVQRIIELAAGRGKKFPDPRRSLQHQLMSASRLLLGLFGRFAGIRIGRSVGGGCVGSRCVGSRCIAGGGLFDGREIASARKIAWTGEITGAVGTARTAHFLLHQFHDVNQPLAFDLLEGNRLGRFHAVFGKLNRRSGVVAVDL